MSNSQEPSPRFPIVGGTAPRLVELTGHLAFLLRKKLWAQIIVAMATGVGVGLLVSPQGAALVSVANAELITGWLVLPGHVFLALIQMIVLPLVASSVMLGIASSKDPTYLRRIGLRIGPYFIATTSLAVTIGTALASWIRPGTFVDPELVATALGTRPVGVASLESTAEVSPSLHDRLVNLIPTNPLGAALDESMLQIVVFSILVGVALINIGNRARPLLDLLASIQQLSMEIVSWAMVLAPLAVFGLLAQITMKVGASTLAGMSVYVGSVLAGLLILLCAYLGIVRVAGGFSATAFLANVREVQLLAFSTSSSAAVMPLSIKTAQEKLSVRPSVAQFTVPLGATVNMDGTALYQVTAAIFLTQVFGVELSTGALLLLIATTVGASIGSPSTPGVGIVILATILQGIGVPAAGIALIIGVDRILDMSRTAINVTGDLAACVVMNRWLPVTPADHEHREG